MKKRVIGSLAVVCSALIATGCGNSIPEMTEEQQELVVEYAAGVVLKYDKNYEGKLVELTLEENAAEEVEASNTPENEEVPETIESAEDDVMIIDNTENVEEVAYTIESLLQLDSVSITYIGYEISDCYPNENEGDDLYFIMNATDGNKLLVLKFLTENMSDLDTELNIAESNARFKIDVDGVTKNALTTMLLNDLAYYQGTLAAGESTELVLVCEVSDAQAEEISSLSLIVKSVDNTATISLN